MTESTTTRDGVRKAAILLVQMGKERSAKILSCLREAEVEELMAEIAGFLRAS